jgi:hypothetical protein
MGYQIGDRKLPLDVAWTDEDGIQRPANWLRLSTKRDRELLGISWVEETVIAYDQRFYWSPTLAKQLNDEAVLDEDGNDTGEIRTGLKTEWKARQNEIAASLLAPSDWRVIKAKETSTNIPSTWKTYRAAVRTACNTRQAEIDACSDVAALKELLFGSATIERQQTDGDGNGVVDDDGNQVMETVANPNIATAWPDPVE